MKYRTRTSSPARRAHYEVTSHRRWVARQIGPRAVGGYYRSYHSGVVYEVLAVDPGPRPQWPTWKITVRTLGESTSRWHCTGWDERDQVVAAPGEDALTYWADHTLTHSTAEDGAHLEQRHLLDEAAHPDTVAALHQLARTARHPQTA